MKVLIHSVDFGYNEPRDKQEKFLQFYPQLQKYNPVIEKTAYYEYYETNKERYSVFIEISTLEDLLALGRDIALDVIIEFQNEEAIKTKHISIPYDVMLNIYDNYIE